MRNQYHEDLDAVAATLVEMARLVGNGINSATQALLDANLEQAESVISGDAAIDAFYGDIEQRCLDILARQQPVARDLRFIITSLRIVADIERMGDLAVHGAKVARRRYPAHAIPDHVKPTILEMGQVAHRILVKCASVVATSDLKLAGELEQDDDVMDALHRQLFTTVLDPSFSDGIECVIDVTLCGRYYERFCDHAVSVARRVTFLVTGEPPAQAASAG